VHPEPELAVVIGRPTRDVPAASALEPAAEASEEASVEADSAAAAIDDPDLRELVSRAARASLSRFPRTDF